MKNWKNDSPLRPGVRPDTPAPKNPPPSRMEKKDDARRTCLVGGRRLAFFHGWFQNSYSTNAILVGEVGGQFSYPVAVVEYADGNVGVVPADHIRFTDGMEGQKE